MKIIHKLFFAVLLLFVSLSSFAQDDSSFRLGIKLGGNLYSTALRVGNDFNKKIKPGFQVGLMAEYAMSETFYLQSGVEFITKGIVLKSTQKIEDGTSSLTKSIGLQYIQVPLMATYKLIVGSDVKVYFRGGPYTAFGIGGKTTIKRKYKNLDMVNSKDKQDSFGDNAFKDFDLGLKFGSGLEINRFVIGLDFEYGLISINRDNNTMTSSLSGKNFKNKGVTLSAGYYFW